MPHSSKRKGNRFEREVVKTAEAHGLDAERAYASDGRSLGECEAVDVLIRCPDADCVRVQAKRRKKIAAYLTPPDGADITVIREDYGDALAVVPLPMLLRLLRGKEQTTQPPITDDSRPSRR